MSLKWIKYKPKIVKYIKIHQNTPKTKYTGFVVMNQGWGQTVNPFNTREILRDKRFDSGRTRTYNLLLRRQAPYPLGHRALKWDPHVWKYEIRSSLKFLSPRFLHMFEYINVYFQYSKLKWRMDTEIDKWLLLSIWI